MGRLDDELVILNDVGSVCDPEICFIPAAVESSVALLEGVRNVEAWIPSERPDLHSDELHLAIEVMRVDDHPKYRKIHNPTLAREREAERDVRAAFPWIGSDVDVSVIADSGLRGEQDHNFTAYRGAFARIVLDHVSKVSAYRDNRPGYSLTLLVHDESSAYSEAGDLSSGPVSDGEIFLGRPHLWFLDEFFTRIIASSGADHVIWYAPNKHMWRTDAFGRRVKVELPAMAIYQVAGLREWHDALEYDSGRIRSVEE